MTLKRKALLAIIMASLMVFVIACGNNDDNGGNGGNGGGDISGDNGEFVVPDEFFDRDGNIIDINELAADGGGVFYDADGNVAGSVNEEGDIGQFTTEDDEEISFRTAQNRANDTGNTLTIFAINGDPVTVFPDTTLLEPENYLMRTHATGARHILIGIPYEHYFDSRHQSIRDNPNVTNPETAQLELDNVRRVEQEHNVFIEFVNMTWDGIRERIPLSVMSGEPAADVFFGEGPLVIPPVLNGMGASLESIGVTQDELNDNRVFTFLQIPGQTETYLFRPTEIFQTMYMIGYNRDMIAEAGLADPQDLWERDEWNWETFREYCRILTDASRNVFGWSGYWTNLLQGLLFSNNAAFAPGPQQTLDHPNTLEVLEFIDTLYNVDRTARPWDPTSWVINNNLYAQGLSAFWIANTWLNNEQGGGFGTEGHHIELPFEFGMVPFPVGPQGNRDTNYAVNVSAANFYFIPRFIENSRQVFDVMYDFTNWFNYDFDLRDDIEWVANSVATEENLRFYLEVVDRGGFDLLFNLGLGSIHVDTIIQHTTHAAEATPAQYVATWAPVFQAALDRYFGN